MVIIRSTIFLIWFAFISTVINVGCLPALLMPQAVAMRTSRFWCQASIWGLKVFAGLDWEIRGTPPPPGVLIASKHMSMWDTMAIYMTLGMPAFVLKESLLNVPFYGWYARKVGMIAIDREAGASALRIMVGKARAIFAQGRSVAIFPEGTRKQPGQAPDYKPGVAGLYGQLDVACAPIALNSGLYWTGPAGFIKKPGRIVIEFLPLIPPGLKRREFMTALETGIETATASLIAEARSRGL
ncbi:MAG TPA: lysophospholipid acyltransferase family protein [Rhizomicrobium sp.]|nr:lysophospholipid acyltransferase family protein [Rhizomicrobium sp.]